MRDALERFRLEMTDDDESVELIDAGFDFIEYTIEDLRVNSYSSNEPEDDYRDTSIDRWSYDSRSIFYDVNM